MIRRIEGLWFDGKTSGRRPVVIEVSTTGQLNVCEPDAGEYLLSTSLDSVKVSSRLGNTPRCINFAEGQKFETPDNEAVDAMLGRHGGAGNGFLHALESRWSLVLMALVFIVVFSWGFVQYGLPAIAKVVAHALPDKVVRMAGEQSLAVLDQTFFSESELEADVRRRVLGYFQPALEKHGDIEFRLEFRQGGAIGANAFALPGGTIVFTDEMIRLAADDDELLGVLAHEIGHIVHRHGERSVIQDSLLVFLIMALTGDSSGIAEVFLGLPVLLAELNYSRNFEREADDHALDFLRRQGIDPSHLPDLLLRIEKSARCREFADDNAEGESPLDDTIPEEPPERDADEQAATETGNPDDRCFTAAGLAEWEKNLSKKQLEALTETARGEEPDWSNYLSTHPSNAERLKKFK